MENPFGGKIHYRDETPSTMADAAAGISSGCTAGDLFMAGHQTAGRGRIPGRIWADKPGDSLLFTLVLPPVPVPGTGFPLSLTAGLALADTLKTRFGLEPLIKWPNDVYLDRKKFSGILVESSGEFSLLGMGVNLNQEDFPGDLGGRAVSLKMITGRRTEPEDFLAVLLPELKGCLDQISGTGGEHLRLRMEKLLFDRGCRVRVLSGHPDRGQYNPGIIRGVSPDGALLLTGDDGNPFSLYSGEVLHS
jgi:BirA family biotin operon repressor/biotin-[acetyl-CoA-carboxylase] ligase